MDLLNIFRGPDGGDNWRNGGFSQMHQWNTVARNVPIHWVLKSRSVRDRQAIYGHCLNNSRSLLKLKKESRNT
jgi:hypothetical protein